MTADVIGAIVLLVIVIVVAVIAGRRNRERRLEGRRAEESDSSRIVEEPPSSRRSIATSRGRRAAARATPEAAVARTDTRLKRRGNGPKPTSFTQSADDLDPDEQHGRANITLRRFSFLRPPITHGNTSYVALGAQGNLHHCHS